MYSNFKAIGRFLRETGGAVTVEYVVLAAGITALGISSNTLIRGGMSDLSGTVDSELRGTSTAATIGIGYSNGFDNGSDGWSGAYSEDVTGIGHVLGPITNTGGAAGISRDFAIHADAEEATFSFNLYSMDNFDGDTGTIFIDDAEVGHVTVNGGIPVFTAASDLEQRKIAIRYTEIDTNVHIGGSDRYADALSNVEIFVRDPGDNVSFGFGSDASAGADNEFFAIDDFTATGLADPTAE